MTLLDNLANPSRSRELILTDGSISLEAEFSHNLGQSGPSTSFTHTSPPRLRLRPGGLFRGGPLTNRNPKTSAHPSSSYGIPRKLPIYNFMTDLFRNQYNPLRPRSEPLRAALFRSSSSTAARTHSLRARLSQEIRSFGGLGGALGRPISRALENSRQGPGRLCVSHALTKPVTVEEGVCRILRLGWDMHSSFWLSGCLPTDRLIMITPSNGCLDDRPGS
jgi:hypothetical protein